MNDLNNYKKEINKLANDISFVCDNNKPIFIIISLCLVTEKVIEESCPKNNIVDSFMEELNTFINALLFGLSQGALELEEENKNE